RSEGLCDWCGWMEVRVVVQVDVIGAQAAKALLTGPDDVSAGCPTVRRSLAERGSELGGDHDLVPIRAEPFAQVLLGQTAAVAVGRVEHGDARVESSVDDRLR